MGWCSGTDVFDSFVKEFLAVEDYPISQKWSIVAMLVNALEDHDWDCQDDSRYYDHPIVREAFKVVHPEWFQEQDDLLWETDDAPDGGTGESGCCCGESAHRTLKTRI